MKEVVGLYGKPWHFWRVDHEDELPLRRPVWTGSLMKDGQVDLEETFGDRNKRFDVDHKYKAKLRKYIELPGVAEIADDWWKEAEQDKAP